MGRIIGTILGAILAIWLAVTAAGGIVPDKVPLPPPADSIPVMPVEMAVKYRYPEQYGIAEVSYIFPGGRMFVLENGLPIMVDDLKPKMRLRSQHGMIITVVAVQLLNEWPDPPCTDENGRTLSRVIGTVKHMANTVMDLTWSFCTTTSTPDHRYYSVSRQTYVPASDLMPGELLRTDTGAVTPVQSVGPKRYGLVEVYNLEIEHFHTYFVGAGQGVLVHNGIGACIEQPKPWEMEEIEEGGLTVVSPNQAGMAGAGGRLGQLRVRDQNALLAGIMRDRGWEIESGGDLGFEKLIPGPTGGPVWRRIR